MDLSADGKTLFVSSIASVFAYNYDATTGTATGKKTLITGMTISGPYHLTRTLRVPKLNPELLLVQRGSNGNIDPPTTDGSAGRSMIKSFNIASVLATPVDYTSGGELLGMGLRNSVGWGQDPTTGGIVRLLPFISSLLTPPVVRRKLRGRHQERWQRRAHQQSRRGAKLSWLAERYRQPPQGC